jgi:hypothetical protein
MTDLTKAEKIVADLERKREACVARGTELADERGALAFAAHANNDAKAKARLEAIHDAISKHASELSSLDAALRSASERLERARQAEATKADRETAKALKAVCAEFLALAELADQQAAAFTATCNALERAGSALSQAGLPPSPMQRVAFLSRAIWTALMDLPQAWRRGDDFRVLGSNEKRTFTSVAQDWMTGAQRTINAKLGEQTTKTERERFNHGQTPTPLL